MTQTKLASTFSMLVVLTAAVGLTGCGQGFSASSSGSTANSATSIGGGTSDAQAEFKSLQVDGNLSSDSDQQQVIELDKTNMQLIARLPVPIGTILGGALPPQPIKEIPGATIGIESLASGRSALVLRVPLSALMKGASLSEPSKLPNGDPLPAIPDGELPSVAVQLGTLVKVPTTVYLAPSVVGLYIESPFNPMPIGSITIPIAIKNKASTRTWGYFSAIPAKAPFKGGFFLSLALPDDVARIIDDVL